MFAALLVITPLATAHAQVLASAEPLMEGRDHPLCVRYRDLTGEANSEICGGFDFVSGGARARWGDALPRKTVVDSMSSQTAAADFVLIGEVHDNRIHHFYQGRTATLRAHRRAQLRQSSTAAVFEHLQPDQVPVLDRFAVRLAEQEAKQGSRFRQGKNWHIRQQRNEWYAAAAGRLLAELNWDRTGWPPGSLFVPLFQRVLEAQLPIVAGNAPRINVRDVARQGLQALRRDEYDRLQLNVPLPAAAALALADDLKASHCGMLPDRSIPNMAAAQVYRDSRLAEAMLEAANTHGSAMLFAGNGHVRKDRGVPWHLKRRAPDKSIIVSAFVEVRDGFDNPEAYVPRDPAGNPAVDFLVLTVRPVRPDPCEGMRKRKAPGP